uniref:Natural cytotoxicity triggering receptor 3 n=1 Tax=Sciurus vulgaris TaxID=55149 RepID=A0A8D2AX47_SCIVU
MTWTLLLIFIMVHLGFCVLWVSQHTQESTVTLLPCSFNASRRRPAIGSVTWYQDKVALGKEVRNRIPQFRGCLIPLASSPFLCDHQADLHIWDTQGQDAGVCVCRVEVLNLGVRTGNGIWLLVVTGPPGLKISTMPLLQAGFYAFGFLSVAKGSTLYFQGTYLSSAWFL